jgi:L-threonylcarbamoyladenylate synthase
VRVLDSTDPADRAAHVALAASALRRGELVVFPTDSVYGVACDAFSEDGVRMLNGTKRRGFDDPLPVIIGSLRTLDGIVTGLSPTMRELVQGFWPGPLTALCRAQPTLSWDIGGDGETVPVRMPLHPLALAVAAEVGPLAVLSANLPGQPAPLTCQAAVEQLAGAVSVYLDAGECAASAPSTIVDLTTTPPRVLRAGAFDVATLREVLPELVADEDRRGDG